MDTVVFNVSFPRRLLKAIDSVAKREARSRSELLRAASLMYVERRRRWDHLTTYFRSEAKRRKLQPQDVERMISEHRAQRRSA